MNFSEPIAYIISQLTIIGQALVTIVKVIINIAVVIFEFVSQLLKLVPN
ncbi:MAG TPA: hypothetical protein VFE87_02645 [Candidatus Paceibacterota bacterium]|nr:hypothetical protein [Candidatus Paceibacterota bacterium]